MSSLYKWTKCRMWDTCVWIILEKLLWSTVIFYYLTGIQALLTQAVWQSSLVFHFNLPTVHCCVSRGALVRILQPTHHWHILGLRETSFMRQRLRRLVRLFGRSASKILVCVSQLAMASDWAGGFRQLNGLWRKQKDRKAGSNGPLDLKLRWFWPRAFRGGDS